MRGSATTIIVIFLGVAIMVLTPLFAVTAKKDEIATLAVQRETTNYVNKIRTTGIGTQEDYDNFILSLAANKNAYDVKFTIQRADSNPAKKTSSEEGNIGSGIYITQFTSQTVNNFPIKLNEGDNITVEVVIVSSTVFGELTSALFHTKTGVGDTVAQASGICTTSAD